MRDPLAVINSVTWPIADCQVTAVGKEASGNERRGGRCGGTGEKERRTRRGKVETINRGNCEMRGGRNGGTGEKVRRSGRGKVQKQLVKGIVFGEEEETEKEEKT